MSKSGGGVNVTFPFFSMLALIFITLKLCAVITWSWWWVLAPIWIPLALFLVVLFGIVAYSINKT